MLAELVLSYALMSSEPIYLRQAGEPVVDSIVQLNVEKRWDNNIFLKITPYVMRNWAQDITGRAGAELELGYSFKYFDLGYYHHSAHNLDQNFGSSVELDMVRMHISLIDTRK